MLAKTTINACKFTQLQRVNPDYTAPGCPADGWMLGVDNNRSLNINNNYAGELRLICAGRGSLAIEAGQSCQTRAGESQTLVILVPFGKSDGCIMHPWEGQHSRERGLCGWPHFGVDWHPASVRKS